MVAKPQLRAQVFKHKAILARNLVFLKSGLVLTTFPPLILKESWLKETQTSHKAAKIVFKATPAPRQVKHTLQVSCRTHDLYRSVSVLFPVTPAL